MRRTRRAGERLQSTSQIVPMRRVSQSRSGSCWRCTLLLQDMIRGQRLSLGEDRDNNRQTTSKALAARFGCCIELR
jgi:hypothetical protein